MPIGTGIVYNVGDLILSQVSSSGTAFLETKIAAATSSLIYFDSTARINSASLNSITVGTASYVSGSTSIITNLTASNISASGRIIASVISSSNAYFSDIGFTNQTVAPDTSVFPTGSTSDGLILDGGIYTNGLYRTRFVKVDRSSNLPLYIQETTSTSGSFRNLARFGTHANSPNTFEVFGSTNIQGAITSSNFVGPHIGNTTGTSSWSTNALTASSLVAANSYAVNNFTASNISCSGYLQSAAAVYQQITSSTFDSASYSNQWVRIAKFDFNIPGTIPFGGFFDEFALKIIANPVSGMQPYSDRFVSPSVALTGSNRGNYANLLISNASYAATPSINVLNAYTYGTALVTKIRSAKDAGNSTWYVDAFITNQSASAVDLMRVEIDSGRGQLQWQLNPSTASYTSNVEFDITIPGVKNANSYVYNFDGNVTSSGNILVGGRVGIGTTSPSEKLHVVGNGLITSGSAVDLRIDASSTGNASLTIDRQTTAAESKILLLDGNVSQWGIAAKSNSNNFVIRDADSTERFTILKTNGNIGIGTTAPADKLSVISGSTRIASTALAGALYFGNDTSNIYLQRDNSYDLSLVQNGDSNSALYLASAGSVYVNIDSNNNDTDKAFIVQNNALKAGTELFRIQENGNVGIGTSNPTAKLQVGTQVFGSAPDANYFVVGNNDFTGAGPVGAVNGYPVTANRNQVTASIFDVVGGWERINGSHALLRVSAYDVINSTPALTVLNNGNVGIGTTSPGAKLDVNGDVYVSPNTAGKNTFILSTNASNDARLLMKSDTTTKVDIQANGTSYFNGGNVGIGTTVPTGSLHVNNSVANIPILNLGGGVADNNVSDLYVLNSYNTASGVGFAAKVIGVNISGSLTNGNIPVQRTVWSGVTSATAIALGTDGPREGTQDNAFQIWTTSQGVAGTSLTQKFSLTSTGDVGIGTTSPVAKLQVAGNISGSSFTSSISNAVGFLGTSSWAQNVVSSSFATTAQTANALNTANSYTITNLTASNISASLTGSFGIVGIGTSSPGAKLDLVGDLRVRRVGAAIILDTNASSDGRMEYKYNGTRKALIGVDSDNLQISADSGNYLQFRTNGGQRMIINNAGGVGIGTSNPNYAFDVYTNGSADALMSIRASGSANARIYFDAANGDLTGGDYCHLGQDKSTLNFVINTGGSAGNIHLQPKGGTNNGILFVSGSTRFGLVSTQNHQFTGSVNISGSLNASNVTTTTQIGGTTGTIQSLVTPGIYSNGSSTGNAIAITSNTTFANQGAWVNLGLHQTTANANDLTAKVYLAVGGWYQNSGTGLPVYIGGGYTSNSSSVLSVVPTNTAGAGNVGIGTPNPLGKLHITSSATNGESLVYLSKGSGSITQHYITAVNQLGQLNYRVSSDINGHASQTLYYAGTPYVYHDTYWSSWINNNNYTQGGLGIGTTSQTHGYGLTIAKPATSGSLYVSGSSVFTGSVSINGLLNATASWANNVVSASFATIAQTANALNASNTYTVAGLTSAYVDVTGAGTIPTTGIYRPSTKTLGLSADSTLIFKISNVSAPATSSIETGNFIVQSGNVGIGTANATDKLTVYGALASYKNGADTIQTQVYLANAGNTRAFNLQLNSGGTGLDLWSYNSSNAWLKHTTFNYDGNVGIGTAAPAAKLEITGSSNSALLNIKSPISGAILYVSGSGAVGIGTSNVGAFTLQVNGSFGATTKSFIIDHPTKAGKKLMYGSLESPYHGIRLTGRDTLVNGKCKVELPDYIYKLILHDSVNIQLTGIKCNKTLYVDDINIPENYFTIAYDKAIFESYKDYDFFWDFTAIRADVPELTTEL